MSTVTATRVVGQPTESIQKHRACDECRTRKLACTKEPDGCSRCKRENIDCHYSPQKQMGRPRKRPRDESNDESTAAIPGGKNTMTELPPDTEDLGLDFIDLVTAGDASYDLTAHPPQEKGLAWSFGYAGDSLSDISFDAGFQHTENSSPFFSTNVDPSLLASILDMPSMEQVPGLTPNSATTPESVRSANGTPPTAAAASTASAPAPAEPAACTHTAALFQALNSMQNVPSGVEEALLQARRATRTAYDAVFCPICSFRMEPPIHEVSGTTIQSFQNLMLLATLIPSIVYAYQRILDAVDEEARRAAAERRRLIFRLHGFGGFLWGCKTANVDDICRTAGMLDHREMEPVIWRLTIRALLRADVYGLSEEVPIDQGLHVGLKDIVLQMEQKSRARHAVMDALVRTGAWKPPVCGLPIHAEGETPTCLKVISIAKAAIDTLDIA